MVRDTPPPPPPYGNQKDRETGREQSTSATIVRGGEEGDLLGYNPTPEDLQIKEVYGDWVQVKAGDNLHGGIADDEAWQG